jgi:CheY-like chemotaxis protein
MEHFSDFSKGVAAIAWPLIVILLLFKFRSAIEAVIESAKSRKFTIKVGGNELTMDEAAEQQNKLLADLQNQVVELGKRLDAFSTVPEQTPTQARTIESTPRPPLVRSILWVDDNPRNNSYEIDILQKMGIHVVQSTSTQDALSKLGTHKFDRIISDMGRYEGNGLNTNAGIDLAKAVREIDKEVPIIIYSSMRAVNTKQDEALAAGVKAITSGATKLLEALDIQ